MKNRQSSSAQLSVETLKTKFVLLQFYCRRLSVCRLSVCRL